MMMLICTKQQLSKIRSSIHEKVSNTVAELKKGLLIKEACIFSSDFSHSCFDILYVFLGIKCIT